MAPQRFRSLQEDSRSESSSVREKQLGAASSGIAKARRHHVSNIATGSGLKDVMAAPGSVSLQPSGHDNFGTPEKVQWMSFDVSVLDAYRQAHRLDTPAAFNSSYNQNILMRPGIAMSSPTMSLHKDRRRTSKDNLALAGNPFAQDSDLQDKSKTYSFGHVNLGSSAVPSINSTTNLKKSEPVQRKATSSLRTRRLFHASPVAQAAKDPYKVLGVNKGAAASDIKKAYYSLAKKYHPDTNKDTGAKDRFAEAQTAYEMLSDPKKKEAWDTYGAAAFDQGAQYDPSTGAGGAGPFGQGAGGFQGFSGGFGGSDINFEDLFGAFMGGGGNRRSRGQGPLQEEILVGQDIEVQTNISFMDAAKGTAKDIFITPLVQCKTCNGAGLKKGQTRTQCKRCGGSGTKVHFVQAGFQMASTCDACAGQGVVTPRGGECGTCKGSGAVRERKTVNIDIPGGVEDGMRLRVSGEGDAPPTGTAANPNASSTRGDLYVFIRVAQDSKFGRSGADVLYTASIPLTTAALGGEVKIPTLEGEVKLKVATGTNTGDKVTLGGMGMPKLGNRRNAAGDLRVEFKVAMPKYLSANQRTILEMLADELGDKNAKRIMNVGPTSETPSSSGEPAAASKAADSHKNEGFLKAAWHKLTHQHEDTPLEEPDTGSKGEEKEEPKKAGGSA